MSFNGQISGSLAPQGAKVGNISGNIGAVVPDIRDESVTTAKLADEAVTTAKLADAAVTIAKLAQDITTLINSKGDATDVEQLQEDVAALQTITAGLGTASTYGVANNLTQAAAGANVLDAYQGKLLGDRMTTAEGDIDTLNDGYTQLATNVFQHHKTITGTITMAANSSGQDGFSVGIDWSVAFAVVRQQDASKLVFLSMGYVDRQNCYVTWRSERTTQSSIPIRIDIFGY